MAHNPKKQISLREGKSMSTENWHTLEMARVKTLSYAALLYTIQDCREAVEANPDNPKNGQYMDTGHYCSMEITRRHKLEQF
jgi:hypothetical protein